MDRERYLLLKNIDPEVQQELRACKAFIAGGAITSVYSGAAIKDYDIYSRSVGNCSTLMQFFMSKCNYHPDQPNKVLSETDCAVTYRYKDRTYQVIKMVEMMGEVRDVLEKFDFTICMGAYDFHGEGMLLHPDFLRHIAQRRLVFNINSGYPICALFRTRKFMARGYKMSGVEALKIGLRIEKLGMTTMADLRKQMMGIDTMFLRELTDALNKPEEAEKKYEFDKAMQMIEECLTKKYTEEEESI
jgi:hypothetical protein